jgi:2-phospho-L-lactate guanylyltransferase
MSSQHSEPRYVVLLPVKPPSRGKSRLVGLPDDRREALAAAFALDTAAAALATPGVRAVLAVTDDHAFARQLSDIGCAVIPDGVSDDLNGSLRLAAAEAARRWPGSVPVALTADLPSLAAADLDAVLARVGEGPAFVRDAAGLGTTLYAALPAQFSPRFGGASAEAHRASGAVEVGEEYATVRRDVDTLADLTAAMLLGLGPRSAEAMGRG